jgi:hypothetical protein
MSSKYITPEQIIEKLREAGVAVADGCRKGESEEYGK